MVRSPCCWSCNFTNVTLAKKLIGEHTIRLGLSVPHFLLVHASLVFTVNESEPVRDVKVHKSFCVCNALFLKVRFPPFDFLLNIHCSPACLASRCFIIVLTQLLWGLNMGDTAPGDQRLCLSEQIPRLKCQKILDRKIFSAVSFSHRLVVEQ